MAKAVTKKLLALEAGTTSGILPGSTHSKILSVGYLLEDVKEKEEKLKTASRVEGHLILP